jgi:hypothetical protein
MTHDFAISRRDLLKAGGALIVSVGLLPQAPLALAAATGKPLGSLATAAAQARFILLRMAAAELGAPLAALHAKGCRHVQQRTVGDRGVGHAPHAQQPQGGDSDGQPAYRPRTASTITVQSGGIAGRSTRSLRSHSRRQAWGRLAGRRVQATGMAQPR